MNMFFRKRLGCAVIRACAVIRMNMVVNIFNRASGFQQSYVSDQLSMRRSVSLLFTISLKSCPLQVYSTWMDCSHVNMIIFSRKKGDFSSFPLVKNVDCGYMLASYERDGSNGYPQYMPLYKTSKHRLRVHIKNASTEFPLYTPTGRSKRFSSRYLKEISDIKICCLRVSLTLRMFAANI